MITSHHLGVSQSARFVLLMQEPGQPCALKWLNGDGPGGQRGRAACPLLVGGARDESE